MDSVNTRVEPPAADTLRDLGRVAGLDALGFTTADPMVEARVVLEARKARGLHDGMQFTFRNPVRSTTPRQALATAQNAPRRPRRRRGAAPSRRMDDANHRRRQRTG